MYNFQHTEGILRRTEILTISDKFQIVLWKKFQVF